MIERYSRKEMRDIWTEQSKFQAWLDVEILIDEAWAQLGEIPMEDVEKIRKNATFTVDRIHEIEQETRHDVVAFTRCVSESLGEEKKWVHYGVTSTDVVDTAYGLRYKKANAILRQDILDFMEILKENALKYKDTIMMGRTHGVHAEITTFGMVFALWYEEMKRNLERFDNAARDVEAGKISGAVGTFANIPPFVQDYVCEKLGIQSAAISTQILQRDRAQLVTVAEFLLKNETMSAEEFNDALREVVEELGTSCEGTLTAGTSIYTVSYNPQYRTSVNKNNLERLKANHPDVYDDYVSTSETRIFSVKKKEVA